MINCLLVICWCLIIGFLLINLLLIACPGTFTGAFPGILSGNISGNLSNHSGSATTFPAQWSGQNKWDQTRHTCICLTNADIIVPVALTSWFTKSVAQVLTHFVEFIASIMDRIVAFYSEAAISSNWIVSIWAFSDCSHTSPTTMFSRTSWPKSFVYNKICYLVHCVLRESSQRPIFSSGRDNPYVYYVYVNACPHIPKFTDL